MQAKINFFSSKVSQKHRFYKYQSTVLLIVSIRHIAYTQVLQIIQSIRLNLNTMKN